MADERNDLPESDHDDAAAALEKAKGHYGQFENAAKYIDPRQE